VPGENPTSKGLPYMPSLDGVRAVAVFGVMVFHGGLSFLPGGFFGVDAFFVLSGFLITSLLVTEWLGKREIALRAFWARRARRLLPALVLLIVAVATFARFAVAPGTYSGLRLDSLATFFYVANWHFIVSGQNYFVATGAPSPLLHTWTLSIEEQFYIVWPLVVLGVVRCSRTLKPLLVVAVAGAVASAVEMAVLFHPQTDPTRVYFGTDTHAQCLLVGAALAVAIAMWRRRGVEVVTSRRAQRVLALVGLVGVGCCAWAWGRLAYTNPFVFRGGILLVALAVGAVIASVVLSPSGIVARALALAPLRFLGRISYGLYLWHFPIDVMVITHARVGLTGWPLFLVRSAVTIAAATVSFYVVERPIRTGTLFRLPRGWLVTPPAVMAAAAAVVIATAVPAGATTRTGVVRSELGDQATGVYIPAQFAHAPVRVLLAGDSVAFTLGTGLAIPEHRYDVDIVNAGVLGCGIAVGNEVVEKGEDVHTGSYGGPCSPVPSTSNCPGRNTQLPCQPWPAAWQQWMSELEPNVVVLLAGHWEVADRTDLQGRLTSILDTGYAAYIKGQLERAAQITLAAGADLIFETAPCFDSGEQPSGAPWPEDSPARLAIYNSLLRQVAAERPKRVFVQNLNSLVCPGGKFTTTLNGVTVRSVDGIHFIPYQGGSYLAKWILPFWRNVGHTQEDAGGVVHSKRAPLPSTLAPA
jgi:peptidoglycan/LPS O-acetylase OafA/YrhL